MWPGGMIVIAMARRADDLTLDDLSPEVKWDEYLRLEDPPGWQFEFEQGRLLLSPSGTAAHDFLRQIIATVLERYEEQAEGCLVTSEHSFFMPPGERDFRPDVAVVTDDRPIDPDAWLEGAPTIAIEVLSKSTRARDLGLKARRYFAHGTQEYWTFDPATAAATFRRRGDDGWEQVAVEGGVYRTPLLPGFELVLGDLWRRLDRKLRR